MFWFLFAASAAVLALSMWRDRRAFRNVFLLLLCLFLFLLAAGTSVNAPFWTAVFVFLVLLAGVGLLVMPFVFLWAGVVSIRREGFSLPHCLSILFAAAMWGTAALVIFITVTVQLSTWLLCLLILAALFMAYVMATFMGLFLYSGLCLILPKNPRCDFVIVHGAGLVHGSQVSPLLKARLDKGIEVFRRAGEGAALIVSGGQGGDETVTEASAMRDYLLAKGIPPERVLLEDRSRTTWENLRFSKELMDARKTDYRVLFVTNDYHVFRAGIYAHRLGLKAEGVGCRTALYYWPNAFIREYIAIIVRHKALPAAIFLLWLILSIVSLLPF